jgi:tRNA(Arg) A34 adenosine deaminase TadA
MFEAKEQFMRAAIDQAIKARRMGNYSIGAVIVYADKIIAKSPNITSSKKDPTQHAEIVAIRKALKKLGQLFLEDCILYTTHEPCPMCATASVWVKLEYVVYGARISDMVNFSKKNISKRWKWRTVGISASEVFARGNPKVKFVGDFLRNECIKLFHA